MRCIILASLAMSLVACGTTNTTSQPGQNANPATHADAPVTNPGNTPTRSAPADSSSAH